MNDPSALSTTLPFVGPATRLAVNALRRVSLSVSLANTLPTTTVSSLVMKLSALATGAALTGAVATGTTVTGTTVWTALPSGRLISPKLNALTSLASRPAGPWKCCHAFASLVMTVKLSTPPPAANAAFGV